MAMNIKLVGAAGGEVTGSAYLVRTSRATVLVDAGMFQGGRQSEAKNRLPQGARPEQIDAVLLTHAHLDHTGRLPLLIRHGFRGPVFATGATIELAEIILKDSARLQVQDAERRRRRAVRGGQVSPEPLYGPEHVDPIRPLAREVAWGKSVEVAEGIAARWIEAGHMLGSASIELTIEDTGGRKVVVFSGDLGPTSMPLIRQYETFTQADLVFLESTYGDREHRPYVETVAQFERIVKDAVRSQGKILVPTFAIGRSQQLLYHLAVMFLRKDVPPFTVTLDSPMAIQASQVYVRHPELHDEELVAWKKRGLLPLDPRYFHASSTAAESRRLNDREGPCAILAGAGMCNAGRILHHLKHNLSNPNTHVVIVGYQGQGSLGRRLVDGQRVVTIHGERIPVHAQVQTLNGFSGHAGQGELLQWFAAIAGSKPRVVLTHGEDTGRQALAGLIRKHFKLTPQLPRQGEVIEL